MKKLFSPLRIIDIKDSGNNGIVYKALDRGRSRALKVMYGFSPSMQILSEKAKLEFDRTKRLEGIDGLPKAYQYYSCYDKKLDSYVSFDSKGFNFQNSKRQIMMNRDPYQSDSPEDLVLCGALTMTYMPIFSKLPRDAKDLPYALPNRFFEKLNYIAEEMLTKGGLSLPPEKDFSFDTNLEPIVLDFGNCLDLDDVSLGMGKKSAENYIRRHNKSILDFISNRYKR